MTQPSSFADYFAQVQATPGWDVVLQSFARFANLPANSRVLDVGCGPGSLARHLARDGHTVTGIDTDPMMIDRAQELAADRPGRLNFEIGKVQQLRFENESFDAALATNVIFLLSEPLVGLKEMARVVRPGGIVAMLNPSPKMTSAEAESLANEQHLEGVARVSLINWAKAAAANQRFSADEAQGLFAKAGLTEVTWAEKVGSGLALLVRAYKNQA
jgi:ubiquinone/menaquinone biosynthesis C-methylase UbiE